MIKVSPRRNLSITIHVCLILAKVSGGGLRKHNICFLFIYD
jgi:hypothetical protein